MIALVAALLIQAAPSATTDPYAWLEGRDIDLAGWKWGGGGEGVIMLHRQATIPPGTKHKRIWLRFERQASSSSSAILYEVDCAEMRGRVKDDSRFSRHNLEGDSVSLPERPNWNYARPGSLLELGFQIACGTARD